MKRVTLLVICLATVMIQRQGCASTCWEIISDLTEHMTLEIPSSAVRLSRLSQIHLFSGRSAVAPVFWPKGHDRPYILHRQDFLIRDERMRIVIAFNHKNPNLVTTDTLPISPTHFFMLGDTFAHRLRFPSEQNDLPVIEQVFRISYLGSHLPAVLGTDGRHLIVITTGIFTQIVPGSPQRPKEPKIKFKWVTLGSAGPQTHELRVMFFNWQTGSCDRVVELRAANSNSAPLNNLDRIPGQIYQQSNSRMGTLYVAEQNAWIVPHPFTRNYFHVNLETGEISAFRSMKRNQQDWIQPLGLTQDGQRLLLVRARNQRLDVIEENLISPSQSRIIEIKGMFRGSLRGYSSLAWERLPEDMSQGESAGLGGVFLEEHQQIFLGSTEGLIQVDLESASIHSQGLAGTSGKRAGFPRRFSNGTVGFWQFEHPDSPEREWGWSFVVLNPI